MKEEIIWEGARLLLFPDISPITQGKREELTGGGGERKEGPDEKHASIILSAAKLFFTSSVKLYSFWDAEATPQTKRESKACLSRESGLLEISYLLKVGGGLPLHWKPFMPSPALRHWPLAPGVCEHPQRGTRHFLFLRECVQVIPPTQTWERLK